MRVAVLGAGSFGTTIASVVSYRHDVVLWARSSALAAEIDSTKVNSTYLPGFALGPRLRATEELEDAVSGAEVLVVAVPSHGFREVVAATEPLLEHSTPVVSLTKGFEPGSFLRMTEVIAECVPGNPTAALAGPNLAKEILSGHASASVVASADPAVAGGLQQVLQGRRFRVYTHHDVVGCEVGGALKNVIAIGAGMAQGLGVGDNTRAAVITRGLAELTRLGTAMGGEPPTFSGLTGLGDLVATCMSPLSRNRSVGEQLGLGRTVEQILAGMSSVAEGIGAAAAAVALGERWNVEIPIARVVDQVVRGEVSAREAYAGLDPEVGHEADPGL